MPPPNRFARSLSLIVLLLCSGLPMEGARFDRVTITLGDNPDAISRQAANLCRRWVERRSGVAVQIQAGPSTAPRSEGELLVHLGLPAENPFLQNFLRHHLKDAPTDVSPGPEGFTLVTDLPGARAVAIAGADLRGVLYGAGEFLLRQLEYLDGAIEVPTIDLSTAPAFPVRGGNAAHISTQVQSVMPVRAWTQEEWEDYATEQVLNGANNFDTWRLNNYNFPQKHPDALAFFQSLGLATTTGHRLNQLPGHPEWTGSEGGDWVCPSIPAARQALLAQLERQFSTTPRHDYLRLYSGDPGGCRCARCQPNWGAVYIRLCEEAAAIWLKYHPGTRVIVTNQELTNDGDRAIFAYAQEKPRHWFYALNYGPGSNAMAPYYRPGRRADLFRYPGLGPEVRYLQEIRTQLPPDQRIIHFSDITHWVQAQFGFESVDPLLAAVHGRRTIYMTPRRHHALFQQVMAFADGDLPYTEGMHDHFNHYLWLRLLWNPRLSAEEIVAEYSRLWFGRRAAPEMTQAILEREANLALPLKDNAGIDRVYRLVMSARDKIPPHLMRLDAWWSLLAQEATLDKYLQLAGDRASRQRAQILTWLAQAQTRDALDRVIAQATQLLDEPASALQELRRSIPPLGDASERAIAFRAVGFYRLDQDYAGNRWLLDQLRHMRAQPESDWPAMRSRLVADGRVEEGEFHEAPGVPGGAPHLLRGQQRPAFSAGMSPQNQLAENSSAYSHRGAEGVAFDFRGLDPLAPYELRLTLVAPRADYRQRLRANGLVISDWLDVPPARAQDVLVRIPHHLTQGGRLLLEFEPSSDSRGTTVSRLWVVKRQPESVAASRP